MFQMCMAGYKLLCRGILPSAVAAIARTPTRRARHASLLMHSCMLTAWDVPEGLFQKMTAWSGRWRRLFSSDQTSRFYTNKRGTEKNWQDESPVCVCVCVCASGWGEGRSMVTLIFHFLFGISSFHWLSSLRHLQKFRLHVKDSLL